MHFAQTDLRVHVGHAIDAITPECRRRAHRLRVASMPEPVLVYADGERLEQVFANLLVNAAKYSADGGAIEVSMERRDGWVSVRVRDSGIGISPSMLPRIFDLFVQGEEASRGREDGQGIGLAVVRELVTKHGGSVQANSAGLGSGSEFTVTLPTL